MDEPRFHCLDCDKIFRVAVAGCESQPIVMRCPLCSSVEVERLPENVVHFLEEGEHAGWAGSIS